MTLNKSSIRDTFVYCYTLEYDNMISAIQLVDDNMTRSLIIAHKPFGGALDLILS